MAISPNDFSLWARLTGNKYPSTPRERAQKGPEVRNFIQNLDKEGMLGGKQEEQKKKEKGLPEKLATGALIAGGIAAGVAAARDPRVQNVAQRAGSATKDKIKDFLVNFSEPRDVDIDIVNASGDVTPDPRQQQTNVAPAQLVGAETYKPAVEGKTFGTSGAVSKLEDIGDAELRARRTYSPMIDAIQQKNPGINVENMQRTMLAKAEKDRDYDIAYMVARGQGKTDETATQIARATAGFPTDSPVGKPTPYREFLGEQRTSSIRKETIDNLLNLVETGPQIILPEKAQNQVDGSSAIVLAGGGNNTNVIPTMGATIGGSSLTDKHATKMAVDNALDIARDNYEKTVSTIVEAGQTKGGSISTAAKAEQFLQKMRPTVVKELDKAIQEDLTKTTGLNPEDAANIAESVINPTTGERQFNTDQFGDLGTETKRDIKDLRSVPNIDPDTKQGTMKTAVGTAIRGRAPSYYEALPKTDTRELPGPFEETVPDRRTATRAGFGAALQKSIEEEGVSPAKMPEGGSAGIGIYGEQPGYVAGPFSSTAKTKPTDAPGTTSPFKGVSDSTLTKLKSDMKPGTKSFESVDKEQKGRASMDAARELRKIQTSGDPSTANERVAKFLDNLKKQQGG